MQPLFPMAIRGIPKYPGKHLSHKFPPTPGLHEQWPEIRSQVVFTLPVFKNEKVQSGMCNLSKTGINYMWSLEIFYAVVMVINIMQDKLLKTILKLGQINKQ